MSIVFAHSKNETITNKGQKETVKESIIDGDKGMSAYYLKKTKDSFYKIYVKSNENKYLVKEKINDKETEHNLSDKELMDKLKKNKNLDFLSDYLKKSKKMKGGSVEELIGGARKGSKKGSKKSSKRKNSRK
jgi:hypothetical protein